MGAHILFVSSSCTNVFHSVGLRLGVEILCGKLVEWNNLSGNDEFSLFFTEIANVHLFLEIRILFWDPAHPISIWKIWKLWHLGVIFFYCQVRRESFRNRLEQRTQHILPSPHVNPTTAQYLLRPSLWWVFIKQTPPQVRVTQYISSGSADGTSVQMLSMQCFGFLEMIQGE